VAINYMELRGNQRRGMLIEEYIHLLEENVALIAKRFEVGYSDCLDLDTIEAELAQSLATLPDLCAQIYQNIYAISILTGNPPEALLAELLPIQPLPNPPQAITVGIRSDLLRRRPDVRNAERQLAAATANIGVAVASFFPTFPLVGAVGWQSLHLHNLFQAQSLTWALAGDIHIPLFQGGKLVGNLRANEAATTAAAFNYQQTVLNALEEAESGLIVYSEELQISAQLKEAARKYASLVFLTSERYAKGLVDLIDLLDSERQWNTALQNLLTSETSALIDLITLYKALGGGWEPVVAGTVLMNLSHYSALK
jgi:outer membrane protein, multidrug efflux system